MSFTIYHVIYSMTIDRIDVYDGAIIFLFNLFILKLQDTWNSSSLKQW